ncbi:dTDP-4-dehydrorhamnose reductase [Devosia sp.]|uniref:dTDP-4-dehydrorhamnose reductase n=1 Tax=Devosia sp. TaxID=1871048 RepID=UPI0025C18882|nr:dTDP-4-dehydrorhamnose reductase [Devosia sp.]
MSGRSGQLARCLMEKAALRGDIELIAIGRPELDLMRTETLLPVLEEVRPEMVISAAAYTAVDKAESEPTEAFAINCDGAGALAAAAERVGASVVHISSDYVFAGDKTKPYAEGDPASPLSAYGLSKYAGELAVSAANPKSVILRTAWAHSPYGGNFIRTMLNLATTKKTVNVVGDRYGSPTSMLDVAEAILHIAGRIDERNYGLYHLTCRGSTSWAGLARHVFAASRAVDGPWADVAEISGDDYKAAAQRPVASPLVSALFERRFSWAMPSWQQSATEVAQRIASEMVLLKAH